MANSSYYFSRGGPSSGSPPYSASIDKNPIYRTNDTFKRAYKKDIAVKEGDINQTDCTSTIWVKFSDPIDRRIVEDLGKEKTRHRYLLECGHTWEGKYEPVIGDHFLPCMGCGAEQSYLGFEHEWQHILFKSDPAVTRVFINSWIKELESKTSHINKAQLERFLCFVLNAFDDIRCNSLWELLYPGSADRIWQRWTRISSSRSPEDNANNFIAFLFSVALKTPTSADGPFEELRPLVEWGMESVRYKGYQRAMLVARATINQCVDTLLAKLYPPPTAQQQRPQSGANNGEAQSGDQSVDHGGGDAETDSSEGEGDAGAPSGAAADSGRDRGAGAPGQDGGGVSPAAPPQTGDPQPPEQTPVGSVLQSLLKNAAQFDQAEKHAIPDKASPTDLSDADRAALARILQAGPDDPELAGDSIVGNVDPAMQAVIDDFMDGITQLSPDSQLIADAKARVLFIDVTPEGIDPLTRIAFGQKERDAVDRMRSVFFRMLGRQKARRESSGLGIDIDAAIQYDIEPNNPEVFEQEHNNQGFAYITLCDMSGSMNGIPFSQVCLATEMLKQSLRFPFVDGTMWGFRSGVSASSEVWIYRYDKKCDGYQGTARTTSRGSSRTYPVQCGGLTPMHTAIRVAVRHLLNHVSSGMAKRLFLLTDGSPQSVKTNGNGLPYWVLQQYVAKEIQWARQRGIQVYTLVIGSALDEKECRQMFGDPKYWIMSDPRGSHDQTVDRALQNLVIKNFEKYLRSR